MPPKTKCLNPVFVKWLEEMLDEVDPDSKFRTVYTRAIKAMRAHDRYLEHPKDCAEVKFVGPKIRDRLIQRHNELQGITSISPKKTSKPSTSRAKQNRAPSKLSKTGIRSGVKDSSDDEHQETPLSQSDSARSTLSPNKPTHTSTNASKNAPRSTKISLLEPLSGSESEPDIAASKIPVTAPRTKLLPQPQNLASTPRSLKRTKPAPSRPRLSNFVPAPAATSDVEPDNERLDEAGDASSPSFEPLVFPAGSYTIQLILDEREVKSTKNRDYILNGLRKRGVDAEKRALEIGDVCWIARLNKPEDEHHAECVLDYILERKRMDDLKSSILDGRFHEQKFRLKHTGISHVYYLVEDYDTERITGQWREQINTALSSTQVIDRFFLKETTSIEDTLDYLARLHKTISMLYKDKALHIIPPQIIKRHRFLALKRELSATDDERTYHTTYQSYQHLNRKNGFYTLQDNMARILQCIKGLSEEKIAALIEHYPTPRSLYEALKEAEEKALKWEPLQESGKGKGKKVVKSGAPTPETMLTELGGQGRRKIGPALSKHIYDIFMASTYES